MSSIGNLIKKLRIEQGLNVTELAEQSDVSRPYLSQIESGKRNPSNKILNKLAQPLGVTGFSLRTVANRSDFSDSKFLESALKDFPTSLDGIDEQEFLHRFWGATYNQEIEEHSSEYNSVTQLLNSNFRDTLSITSDSSLNETEKTIIREHLNKIILDYQSLIEKYLISKISWGNTSENFIAVYKEEMDLNNIKELFIKQQLGLELNTIKDNIDSLPKKIINSPSFK